MLRWSSKPAGPELPASGLELTCLRSVAGRRRRLSLAGADSLEDKANCLLQLSLASTDSLSKQSNLRQHDEVQKLRHRETCVKRVPHYRVQGLASPQLVQIQAHSHHCDKTSPYRKTKSAGSVATRRRVAVCPLVSCEKPLQCRVTVDNQRRHNFLHRQTEQCPETGNVHTQRKNESLIHGNQIML